MTSPVCVRCSTEERPVNAAPASNLCDRCANLILQWLREWEMCSLAVSAVPAVTGEVRGAPGYSSASPANDDAIAHADPRGHGWPPPPVRTNPRDREPPADSDGDDALAMMWLWERSLREEYGLPDTRGTVTVSSVAEFLRRHHGQAAAAPWVDEYAGDAHRARSTARRLAGLSAGAPRGDCLVCGGPVWTTDDASGVRCSACGEYFTGPRLLLLQQSTIGDSATG